MEDDVPTGCAPDGGVDVVGGAEGEDGPVDDSVVVDVLSRFDDWASEQPAAVKAMLTLAAVRNVVRRMVRPYGKKDPMFTDGIGCYRLSPMYRSICASDPVIGAGSSQDSG